MKNIHSVIGLGYGDEGKGVTVDYLCSKYDPEDVYVVRHSGGHQVGHTVMIYNTIHEFRHFGAGTMRGVPTIWSKRCTVSPFGFRQERDILLGKKIYPKLFVHSLCPVTTLYDIAYNRTYNRERGIFNSVGVGFSSTLIRHETVPLYVSDLHFKQVLQNKLNSINKHYYDKCQKEGVWKSFKDELAILIEQSNGIDFLDDCDYFIDNIVTYQDGFDPFVKNVVFEGNQGILLDKNHGFYPNVTHGTTTNATLKDWTNEVVDTWYPTRIYSTRHGDGPFFMDGKLDVELRNTEHESNHNNNHQGVFRYAPLNIDLLQYALLVDQLYVKTRRQHVVVTCFDQLDSQHAPYCIKDELCKGDVMAELEKSLDWVKLYVNASPRSNTVAAW